MRNDLIRALAQRQSGMISRRQLLGHGANDNDIARWVRRRVLTRVIDGVFATHTGPLDRDQREWAAILKCEPAVLTGVSALRAWGARTPWGEGSGRRPARLWVPEQDSSPIQLMVASERRVTPPTGVRISRSAHFARVARLDLTPPRVSAEAATLEAAARMRRTSDQVAVLADVCQQGVTTVPRLLAALELLPRLPNRAFLRAVLADVAAGAYSVLERRYLRDVEIAHALPTPTRQRGIAGGAAHGRR